MLKLINTYLLCILATFTHFTLFAQGDNMIWVPIQNQELATKQALIQRNMPSQFQAYRMTNLEELERILHSAPLRFSAAAKESNIEISLPLPDGQLEKFRIFNFPVLQSRLAAAYPNLRTFTAAGISHPNKMAKIEVTPKGLHAMILGGEKGPVFINPFNGIEQTYYSFYKKDIQSISEPFLCGTKEFDESEGQIPGDDNLSFAGDCQLRQYRLALACTGEFAQLIDDGDDTNGDIVADVLADMVIVMDRINGIFERDVGVTMLIIDENEEIIFTDPDNDFYSNNISSLPAENSTAMQITIGNDAFDIAHVFGSTGGGVGFLEGPCGNAKAKGASGRGNRTAEEFAFDIVAHEMGHQFGARHTQNTQTSFCFVSETASYEPGSGSTIMSYARVCPPLVQTYSDNYFHAISIEQIGNFVTTDGNTCPVILSSENNKPSVAAGGNYTIPAATPFVLTGVGTDPDDDPISYCWEQWDKEDILLAPPIPTATVGPTFRSFLPTVDPQRYFPSLSVLLGETPDTWEVLPTVSRELNFRLTVRDNNSAYGCTDESNMSVVVDDSAGPFAVTSPDTFAVWNIGDTELITWDVANTDLAPINCATVDILLSTDGGYTYPDVIATNVPNNGSYEITVPSVASATVRFMVRCSDNIFFNISKADVSIGVTSVCAQIFSTDIPITISEIGSVTITSELNIDITEMITNIKVINLNGTHTYVGDLRFTLISPSGIECLLMSGKCTINNDFDINFDDAGNMFSCPLNDGQITKPESSLSIYNGLEAAGNWSLEITDIADSDGGELLGWGIEICYDESLISNVEVQNFEAKVELTPNPTNQNLIVALASSDPFKGQLQVVNMIGQTLEQVDVESDGNYQHEFRLAYLPAGVYFVKVVDEKGNQVVEKFIKQ